MLRTGLLPEGYGQLALTFGEAAFERSSPFEPEDILRNPLTRLGYEELDVDWSLPSAPYLLRLLLFPTGELELRFKTITTEFSPIGAG